MPTNASPAEQTPPQLRPQNAPDAAQPRFFLDAKFDADLGDADWWLDLGGVDLPAPRPCNPFTTPPRP